MEELEQILRQHAMMYPQMQPTDAVKLIYQNEFGGGHLIRDEAACLEYLRREYNSVVKNPQSPLWEEIGNGIVRIHLSSLPEIALPWLGRSFLTSAAEHRGTISSFLEKLEVLRSLVAKDIFSFDTHGLERYLDEYRQAGYPAVSHSRQYRDAYHPAYRIICRRFLPAP